MANKTSINPSDIEEVLSIDKRDLLIYLKHQNEIIKTYVCKECIDVKTKKTKRLLTAIKHENDLNIKIVKTDDNSVLNILIQHPLYDDDKYVLHDSTTLLKIVKVHESEQIEQKIKPIGYIYVLELDQNKYYIGKSNNPLTRTGDHVASTIFDDKLCGGSGWTKMYKPLKILEIITSYSEFDEDTNTLKYMKKHGVDNVRGGSFCELNLSKDNVNTLIKMLAGADDRCYYCGGSDHYIADCPQKNLKRIPQKHKKLHIKAKDVTKSKIMKFYGATQLLQNSNIIENNNTKEKNKTIKNKNELDENHICRYCKKNFRSLQSKKNHENILCEKNVKVQLANDVVANVDAILEKNKHYLKENKRK